jgi:lactobin A/cerein 7B family class IIb bacteriocin
MKEGFAMDEMRIKEVFSNEEFVKSIMELETPEEVQEALRKESIDLSIDEIVKILNLVEKKIANDGELNEEELESVTGGFLGLFITACVGLILGLTAMGTGIEISSRRRRW